VDVVSKQGRGLAGGVVSGDAGLLASVNNEGEASTSCLLQIAIRRYQLYSEDESLSAEARELASVFLALLEDPALSQAIERKREAGLSLNEAVFAACHELSLRFKESRHQYLRDRAVDIITLAQDLTGRTAQAMPSAIWLVPHLTPSVLFAAKESMVKGVVCSDDLPSSGHLAILARGLSIALVCSIPELQRYDKQIITINGQNGLITYGGTIEDINENDKPLVENPRLWLNAASSAEVAHSTGFSGVGLFRTEFIYLKNNRIPSLQEELEEYIAVLKAAKGRPVVFRLLDFGADKPMPGSPPQNEPNPLLGQRGIRLLLNNPSILERQLGLLVRASQHGDVRVMVPMVTLPAEIIAVREKLVSLGGEHIPLGAMIEIPAAALLTPELCQVADFLSLGTNDLAAYTYATDRLAALAEMPDEGEALMRLIRHVVMEAKKSKLTVGVCGELAASTIANECS